MTDLWVGGYTADSGGESGGIVLLQPDLAGRLRIVGEPTVAESPSWLVGHPRLPVIYAAQETAGTVIAFRRAGDFGLARLGEPVGVGAEVCHLAVAPAGDCLIASCYGDGAVLRIGLAADGGLADAVSTEPSIARHLAAGREPPPSRAHAAAFLADGRLASTDLGHDSVRIWRPTADGLRPDHQVDLPAGSGPRHLTAHPSGLLYVVTEYSCEILILSRSGADWELTAGIPLSRQVVPGRDFPAELSGSADGGLLYAGVRGSNVIATLAVADNGTTLQPVALSDCGGDWPRHHLLDGSFLRVANQRSGDIATLALDSRTGVPERILSTIPVGSPACLLVAAAA
jgi:6-phosphogluconolactonase